MKKKFSRVLRAPASLPPIGGLFARGSADHRSRCLTGRRTMAAPARPVRRRLHTLRGSPVKDRGGMRPWRKFSASCPESDAALWLGTIGPTMKTPRQHSVFIARF